MLKYLSLILLLIISFNNSIAQKATYNIPKQINKETVRITFKKINTSSSSYFINYKAENIGNGILVIDRSLTSLSQNEGQLFPISDTYVIKPGTDKTVYNQFRIKPPVKANADLLSLEVNGMQYATFSEPLKTEKLVLAEKVTQKIGQFTIKVMEYNVYSDRVYAEIKCSFDGVAHSVGNIDLSKLIVHGGTADIVKKGDIVFSGKSYSFAINITPDGEELHVNFNNVLSVTKLKKIDIEPITIKSTTYIAPKESENTEEEKKKINKEKEQKKQKEQEKVAELSYSDFTTLKKDIEVEMNAGGKPIDMAQEFLMEKGTISTAQVIDIIAVFNLDGSRLKFAKMAYPFTSDKTKYHMVVGKLAYTKNKQALEEFLENQ